MKRKCFYGVKDFCSKIVNDFDCMLGIDEDITIVAKYNYAKIIIKELCKYFDIASIEICNPDFDFYYDEYVISVYDNEIWCQPAKRDDKYISDEPTILYVHEDCNSKVLNYFRGSVNVEFGFCNEDCFYCDSKQSNSDVQTLRQYLKLFNLL